MGNSDFIKDIVKDNIGELSGAGLALIGAIGAGVVAAGGLITKKVADNVIRDENGYNRNGYDRNGYDKVGYNKAGYNRDGYDRDGYDRRGYNRAGYDRTGYNYDGYDRMGYDRNGYDANGYNRAGYDQDGFNKYGFNYIGQNRGGRTLVDLKTKIVVAQRHLRKAYKELDKKSFSYSLMECRQGMEGLIKELILHYLGSSYYYSDLCKNINVCEQNGLITSDESTKLHQARMHCNDAVHGNEEKTYNQVFFVCKMLEWLIEKVSSITRF